MACGTNTKNPRRPLWAATAFTFAHVHLSRPNRSSLGTMHHFLFLFRVHFSHSGVPKTFRSVYFPHPLHALDMTLGMDTTASQSYPRTVHVECRYASYRRRHDDVFPTALEQRRRHISVLVRMHATVSSSVHHSWTMCTSTWSGTLLSALDVFM